MQNYPLNQLTSCFRFHFLLNNSVLSSSGFNNLYRYSIIKLIYLIIWILIILFLANEFFSRLIRTREIWRSSKNLNELDIGPFQNFLQMIVNFTMIVSALRFMSDKTGFGGLVEYNAAFKYYFKLQINIYFDKLYQALE